MISATVRDIAIIVVAIQTLVIGALLSVLIWQVWRMVKILQTEIKPIILDTQETVGTVRGTAAIVSDNVIAPVVRTNRAIFRMRGTLKSLTSDLVPRRAGSTPPGPSS